MVNVAVLGDRDGLDDGIGAERPNKLEAAIPDRDVDRNVVRLVRDRRHFGRPPEPMTTEEPIRSDSRDAQ